MQAEERYDTFEGVQTLQGPLKVLLADRYRIVRKLGEGGMGSVWLAEDMMLDGRHVAIKMLPVIFIANKRAIQQLKAEARVAIQLAHSNIATLRAFEESRQGPFLVMDYIEGRTLESVLSERGPLPEQEVIQIFTPIAQAIDYAHRQNVIHRDIKPSNILIRNDGTPFITDFGIAREITETLTRMTGVGTSGTLPYMSPEQVRGEPPSRSQDIYSLAATLYECLSGHPPFYRGQIEYQIVNMTVEALKTDHLLAQRILQALDKAPERRPSTAERLLVGSSSSGEQRPEQRTSFDPVPFSKSPESMRQRTIRTTVMMKWALEVGLVYGAAALVFLTLLRTPFLPSRFVVRSFQASNFYEYSYFGRANFFYLVGFIAIACRLHAWLRLSRSYMLASALSVWSFLLPLLISLQIWAVQNTSWRDPLWGVPLALGPIVMGIFDGMAGGIWVLLISLGGGMRRSRAVPILFFGWIAAAIAGGFAQWGLRKVAGEFLRDGDLSYIISHSTAACFVGGISALVTFMFFRHADLRPLREETTSDSNKRTPLKGSDSNVS